MAPVMNPIEGEHKKRVVSGFAVSIMVREQLEA